jgi:parallel beta-helix repeat protein
MSITHSTTMVSGERGYAADWNADHVISDDLYPKREATLIIAASDSNDTDRADYVCDGTADQTEINNAISSLPANGGRVLLLDGNFSINGSIIVSRDNVTLQGQGRGTAITWSQADHCVKAEGKEDIVIRDLCLDGTGAAGGSAIYTNELGASRPQRIRIMDVWIISSTWCGVEFHKSDFCLVMNCYVTGSGYWGIELSECTHSEIKNNTVTETIYEGIYVIASDHNIITTNVLLDNSQHGANEYSEILLTFYATYNNIVNNNIDTTNGKYCIQEASSTCD